MIQKLLTVWLCFGLCSIAIAQNSFQIKGTILDGNTLQPIDGATVRSKRQFSISSITGEFTIKNVPEGVYEFTISHVVYGSKSITVNVGKEMEDLTVFLIQASNALQEVAIMGKSKKRLIQENPFVSNSVSKEFLEKNRENSLMQTLSKIPGVSTINIGSGQSKPVIRGLGFNRVVVVHNGIKHEAQQWGNDHGLEIDQYGLENIEIIKGPASLLYGSDAIAGVVDIQAAKTPQQKSFKGEVNLLAETNNDLFGISTGIEKRKEKWFYRGRITYKDYADYKVPTDRIKYDNYIFELYNNNLRNTAGTEANASFRIGYVSDNVKSETFLSNVNFKNGFFANAHGLEVRNSSIDYDRSNRDINLPFHIVNHFKVAHNTTFTDDKHTFHFDLGFQNNNREEHSEPVPHGYMPKPPNNQERVFNKNTYTLNVRDAFKPNNQHDIVVGLNVEIQDNNIGGWGFLIPEYTRFSIGAFAYNKFEINPNFHFLAGIRYDYGIMEIKSYTDWYSSIINNSDGTTSSVYLQRAQNKTLDFGNISGAVGLSYILKNTTYKINIGKSFRMPLANELASDGVNYHMYRYEKGNLDLSPEVSYQLDIDFEHSEKQFSVGISPFINLFENYIYLNPTSNYYETLQIYEYTQSKVFRVGGEVKAGITPWKSLQLEASAEYVFSRQTTGDKKDFTLPFSPPLSALLTANYRFKDFLFFNRSQLIANLKIVAAQNEIVPPEEKTDGHQLFNFSFETEMNVFKNNLPIGVRVKLNNVFNTKYYDHTSFYRLISVPEASRNLAVSLNIHF